MARAPKAVSGDVITQDELERRAQIAAGREMPDTPALFYAPEPERDELEESEDEILANVIADLGGPGVDAKVNVYQLDAQRNKAFVRSYLPAEFSLENIQAEYGPGDYEVHVRRDGRLATRKVIKIATPKVPQQVPVPQSDNREIIAAMNSGFQQMASMFSQSLERLVTAQPKPKTTMETLQELTMMRDIMGGNVAQQAPAQNPMEIIELAKTLAENITPRTGEPGTGEIILETLKNIGPLLMNAQRNMPMPVVAHAPQMPAIPQTPALQQNPVPETDEMSIQRKIFLAMLIRNAANNNDPETYANMLLDQASEAEILEFAHREDWFELLCKEAPSAAPYRPWFEEMRLMVLDLTKPESDDTTVVNELTAVAENVSGTIDANAASNS